MPSGLKRYLVAIEITQNTNIFAKLFYFGVCGCFYTFYANIGV